MLKKPWTAISLICFWTCMIYCSTVYPSKNKKLLPQRVRRGIQRFCRQLIPNSDGNKIYIVNLSLRFLCTCHICFLPKKNCIVFCALIVFFVFFFCALFAHSMATMQPLICCINPGLSLGRQAGRRGGNEGWAKSVCRYSKEPFLVHYRKISMSTLAGGNFSLLVTLSPSPLFLCVCVFSGRYYYEINCCR